MAFQATAAAMPAPFSTPNAEAVPAAAQPLKEGDYGIAEAGSGSLKGTLSSKGLTCDNDGFLHVDTDDGAYVAESSPLVIGTARRRCPSGGR